MKKNNTSPRVESSPVWEEIEGLVREEIQKKLQELLEEEVRAFLGRAKHERKAEGDAHPGYRNGYGKPRKLTLSSGTVTLRRPRMRNLEERFQSRLLPFFKRRSKELEEVLPELYLHGLSQGDFDLALRGLLGEEAPLSANSIARLKARWQSEYEEWKQQDLSGVEVVYLWVDGIYIKAGLEKEKAALLVVLAALSDGRKVFLAIEPGYRESIESWSEVLRDLKRRGLKAPKLVCGDGHLGIWGALRNVYPQASQQRCWNHRILNILQQIPPKYQAQALARLKKIPYAETRKEALRLKRDFQSWALGQGYEKAAQLVDRDWQQMLTFYSFPQQHWRHLRTTNPLESPFAAVRLRTNAAKRFKKVANASALIWKTMMVAQTRFRKLKAPELLKEVYEGTLYQDGIPITEKDLKNAA